MKLVLYVSVSLLLSSFKLSAQNEATTWTIDALKDRSRDNLDSTKWNHDLFSQDIETCTKHADYFESYPLKRTAFPVADYDYAVSSKQIGFNLGDYFYKGIVIDEWLYFVLIFNLILLFILNFTP